MGNDGMLSQDEIDALLQVGSDEDENDDKDVLDDFDDLDDPVVEEDYLSSIEKDALGEIGNISFGSSATTLSTLLNQKVEITTPAVTVIRKKDLLTEFDFEHCSIEVRYVEGFTGQNVFVIKAEDAAIISDVMLGGDGLNPDQSLTEIHLSAVQEAMNQMMGAAATSMSTIFNKKIDISPPSIEVGNTAEDTSKEALDDEVVVQVSFQLKVGDLIDSNIMQLIPFPFANELVDELLNPPEEKAPEPVSTPNPVVETPTTAPTGNIQQQVQHQQAPTHVAEQQSTNNAPQMIGSGSIQQNSEVQQAAFSSFEPVQLNQNEKQNLNMLLDIPLKVTVELGRTKRTIKDILDLTKGSIIELDKLAGEPVDVLVNQKLIAKGEVVVIDENFGVRITDIISQTDRLMKLN